jgi:hypothetical protein
LAAQRRTQETKKAARLIASHILDIVNALQFKVHVWMRSQHHDHEPSNVVDQSTNELNRS